MARRVARRALPDVRPDVRPDELGAARRARQAVPCSASAVVLRATYRPSAGAGGSLTGPLRPIHNPIIDSVTFILNCLPIANRWSRCQPSTAVDSRRQPSPAASTRARCGAARTHASQRRPSGQARPATNARSSLRHGFGGAGRLDLESRSQHRCDDLHATTHRSPGHLSEVRVLGSVPQTGRDRSISPWARWSRPIGKGHRARCRAPRWPP